MPAHHSKNKAKPWQVAIIANTKEDFVRSADSPPDAGAEFDYPITLQSIQKAIENDGHRVAFIPANEKLPFALEEIQPDICFNIAEGLRGDAREAQVPALLEMMGIPYTASRVLSNAISLDKVLTKRLWRDAGLPVGAFQEMTRGDEALHHGLQFPLFVKPAREGSGMGIDADAIVKNETELRKRVRTIIDVYRQPALVETYLSGREFTIGVLGHPTNFRLTNKADIYNHDGFHRFPIMEINTAYMATPGMYSHSAKAEGLGFSGPPGWLCPAVVEKNLEETLQSLALRAHQEIGALDISRVDFRLDKDGNPCLLEINLLPGLNPMSDFILQAKADGLTYQDIILEVLHLGAARYGLIA